MSACMSFVFFRCNYLLLLLLFWDFGNTFFDSIYFPLLHISPQYHLEFILIKIHCWALSLLEFMQMDLVISFKDVSQVLNFHFV